MKKIKYIIGAACLALTLNSCSDFLNEEPVSEIPAGDMWQTARDAKAGVNEIYGLLRSTLRENYFYWGEFRSDNVAPGAPVMADQSRVINNLMSTDEKCGRWTTLYQMINQTNLAIKYVPNISMPDVADRNDYLGQAYALRALAYFYAIRVWGDVPLFVEPTEKYSEAIYKTRTDKNYILENVILPDLKKAETLINRNKNYERKRISICGVWAIMADVYMWTKEYNLADQTIDKMATIASKKGGKFVDFEPSIATWHTMFTEELTNKPSDDTPENDEYNSREFIFLVHFNMDEVGTNGYSYMYQWFSGSGNRAAVMSDQFMGIFNEDDMRGDLRKDYTVKNYQNGNELRKFMAGDISNSLNKTCEVAYPIYRYTDMMLLQAEARAHQGKWGEALDLVKTVRDRAGLNTPTENDFASEEEVIDYILRERQVELAGEGRRWFDLVRTGKWKEVMKPINGMEADGNELFPIHYSHILENPKIEQNAYYGNSNNYKIDTMKKIILCKTLFFCWAILALTGCDLDLQKNYDYEPSIADPYVKVTAWEYFQDHKDMFSELIAAIEYTGLKDYYTQTDNKYTFLALNNTGMQAYRDNEFAGATSITDCDKDKVTNMLLYHIVDGEYSSYGQLQVEPMFVLTMLKGESGLMTMSVWKNPWQAAVGKILVNQTGSNGRSPQRQAKTSNILPTNGVIHIFENYCRYSK